MFPKIVFSDFDGTLTLNEELGPVFFDILDLIQEHKSELVIVTGRSLSWAHFLLTHFPLKAVIAEGGGVMAFKDGKTKLLHEETLVDQTEVTRLEDMTRELKRKIPEVILSPDSFGRKTDRALEFHYMPAEVSDHARTFFRNEDINFSQSNVHINFWCGEISKHKAVTHFLRFHRTGISADQCIFFGDSLNDQSMFEKFPLSVGVSNIHHVINQLQHQPKVILHGADNAGPFGVFNYLKSI